MEIIGRRVLARSVGLFGVLGVLLFLAQAQTTHAATITVNTTDDELNSDGDCSLREAIEAANTDSAVDACTSGSGADVLTLPVGTYTLTLNFALVISTDLTLSGAGANTTIIQAAASPGVANFLVVQINPGATVTISGVTIRHGNVVGSGGGIFNSGALTLVNSTIRDNNGREPGISVGGIFNSGGTVTLTNSTISNNTAAQGCGGIFNTFAGTTMITNSTISGNGGIFGGGICIFDGEVTLTNSTVSGNVSTFRGGGIFAQGGTLLRISNSTISGNSSPFTGGGIFSSAATQLVNTIIANNPSGGDCSGGGVNLTSLGHNLDSDGTCNLTDPTDLPNTDPLLGPLQDNGGSTFTHALLPSSPAIDAGNPATPGSGGNACEAADQRRVPRLQACDIGAFELVTSTPGVPGPPADLGVILCEAVAVPPIVRAEGIAELVGDIVITCFNTPPPVGGSLVSHLG